MIPKAINNPTANAAPIDSATAATGFIGRGALLIGTIHLPNCIGAALWTSGRRRDNAGTIA
jgi:hypothetical protein